MNAKWAEGRQRGRERERDGFGWKLLKCEVIATALKSVTQTAQITTTASHVIHKSTNTNLEKNFTVCSSRHKKRECECVYIRILHQMLSFRFISFLFFWVFWFENLFYMHVAGKLTLSFALARLLIHVCPLTFIYSLFWTWTWVCVCAMRLCVFLFSLLVLVCECMSMVYYSTHSNFSLFVSMNSKRGWNLVCNLAYT